MKSQSNFSNQGFPSRYYLSICAANIPLEEVTRAFIANEGSTEHLIIRIFTDSQTLETHEPTGNATPYARLLGILPQSPIAPEGLTVRDLLTELNETQSRTIVMVLHDLNQAARYADHLVVIEQGQIYDQGTPGSKDPTLQGTVSQTARNKEIVKVGVRR